MAGPIFVDTWGWLALGHRRDAHHHKVKECFESRQQRREMIHTSDYVLDELITLLFRRERAAEAEEFIDGLFAEQVAGKLQIHRVTPERFMLALEMRRRLRDKPLISFTDLSSVVIMNELGIKEVLRQDEHFVHVGMRFEKIP